MASYKVKDVKVNLQNGTDRNMYATWTFSKKYIDHYEVKWSYDTGNGIWFIGNEGSVTDKQATYSAPSNALKIRVVIKPVSKTYKKKKKTVSRWTGGWSSAVQYAFTRNPPTKPAVPSVEIKDFRLTAEVNDYEALNSQIEFQIVQNDRTVVASGKSNKVTNHAAYSCTVAAGGVYKARCRALRGSETSEWTEYSQNVGTIPSTPGKITECCGLTESSVKVSWQGVANATSYEIEYATKRDYFDSSKETQSMSVEAVVQHAEVTGLDSGKEWFFRVRAVNDKGHSGWTGIVSTVIGKAPSPPTTWSSTTTAMVGETVILYWVHNTEDGSRQTAAEIELIVNGASRKIAVSGDTTSYSLPVSGYADKTKIQWCVRTKGFINKYSEWSIQRIVDVYAPPVLTLTLGSSVLSTFPLVIRASARPITQTPIGYYITISPNQSYQTTDHNGRTVWVNAGEEIYSKHFDIRDRDTSFTLSAGDLSLENNVTYTIHCTASMNIGLSAEATCRFTVNWIDEEYDLNAEIGIEEESVTAYICPFCEDEAGNMVSGVLLSVYRREFDGSFVELARDIENGRNITITDPHPALDYARYRIVGMSKKTGSISYYDLPGYPVDEKAVIIQWDEEWSNFDTTEEAESEEPSWSGSLLRLPYNIDVSDNYGPDVALVKYIGRKHPVSYYGTQIGETASWNVEIHREDEETLYALRRLAIWMGDCYVREPSGSGYWAQVGVSFSQKHCELTIPVSLSITRVDGGA